MSAVCGGGEGGERSGYVEHLCRGARKDKFQPRPRTVPKLVPRWHAFFFKKEGFSVGHTFFLLYTQRAAISRQ